MTNVALSFLFEGATGAASTGAGLVGNTDYKVGYLGRFLVFSVYIVGILL